jgi:peptidoglycan LD-endopeptidase LytH
MRAPRRRLKPGWYVLAALAVYAAVATSGWRAATVAAREARLSGVSVSVAATAVPDAPWGPAPTSGDRGLWFPIPGARIPNDDNHLPGAERAYRAGVSQGFTFWGASSSVPIVYGTPVVAAAEGVVVRVDEPYLELTRGEWDALLARVAGGAADADLDRLRGRQIWLRLDDGRVVRYGHLASVRPGLTVGSRVTRGRVIGTVGNSGTGDGVAGRTTSARLHFEVWDDDTFLGQGRSPTEVRLAAASLFTGP